MYNRDSKFWELGDYKDAHLSKVELPEEHLERINAWWADPKNFLVFLGNPGCGKTYLIAALIHSLRERPRMHHRYLHEKDFFSLMRSTIEKGWDYEYEIKALCETRLIFMDDIHSGQSTDFQKECLFSFVDQRIISGYPTVITSNLFLDQMAKNFSERFVSRIKSKKNTVIELNWIDKRQE